MEERKGTYFRSEELSAGVLFACSIPRACPAGGVENPPTLVGRAALESREEKLSTPGIFSGSDEEAPPGLADCGVLGPDKPVELPPKGFPVLRVPDSSDPPPAAAPLTEGVLGKADLLEGAP